jgi:hypothetical protein
MKTRIRIVWQNEWGRKASLALVDDDRILFIVGIPNRQIFHLAYMRCHRRHALADCPVSGRTRRSGIAAAVVYEIRHSLQATVQGIYKLLGPAGDQVSHLEKTPNSSTNLVIVVHPARASQRAPPPGTGPAFLSGFSVPKTIESNRPECHPGQKHGSGRDCHPPSRGVVNARLAGEEGWRAAELAATVVRHEGDQLR